jgi:hypothetical protein
MQPRRSSIVGCWWIAAAGTGRWSVQEWLPRWSVGAREPPSFPLSSVVVVSLSSVGRAASSRLPPEIRPSADNAGEKMPAHPPYAGWVERRFYRAPHFGAHDPAVGWLLTHPRSVAGRRRVCRQDAGASRFWFPRWSVGTRHESPTPHSTPGRCRGSHPQARDQKGFFDRSRCCC